MDVRITARRAQYVIRWMIIAGVVTLLVLGVKAVVADMQPKPLLDLGKATFRVELAETPAAQEKGLAGRTKLAEREAMLFVFPEDDTWKIWMKGMKMPIDIVWLDRDKKVVHIEENVQPDAEPYEVYQPPVPARYVLEMAAGSVQKFAVKKDMTAKLYNDGETSR